MPIPTVRAGFASLPKSPCDLHNQNMETPRNTEPPNTRWLLWGLWLPVAGTTFLCYVLLKGLKGATGAGMVWLSIASFHWWATSLLPVHPIKRRRCDPPYWITLASFLALTGTICLEEYGPAWIANMIHRILCHPAAVVSLWVVMLACLYRQWRVGLSLAQQDVSSKVG